MHLVHDVVVVARQDEGHVKALARGLVERHVGVAQGHHKVATVGFQHAFVLVDGLVPAHTRDTHRH